MWGSQAWNQWALQPSMFNNVPHDEIDWAALAKQWIQMQKPGPEGDAGHMISPSAGGPPPPPPPLPPHMPPQMVEDYSRDGISPVPLNVDQFSGGRPELPNAPTAIVHPESVPNFGTRDASDTYWHPEWENNMSGDIDERVWAPPPPVMMPAEKKTFDYGHIHDNPTLAMQTVDYNHVSEHYYNQMYTPEDPYDQYWSQVGSAPMMPPSFLKKDRVNNFQNEEDTSHIDAAKRKQLPAWIREGLEKMEQERLKRLEKERAEKEQVERAKKSTLESPKKGLLGTGESSSISMPSKSKFESDSEHEDEEPQSKFQSLPSEHVKSRHPSPPVEEVLTEEERQHQLVLKVRRLLTEILLDVTNSEMAAIAKEIHSKALAKAPAKPLTTTTALRSLATGLHSLASYESHSDVSESEQDENDSSTSDEELHRRIQEKRRKFASKERKIIAEIEEAELREKERKKFQNTQDNRNSESSADHLKSKKSLSAAVKSESEIETKDSSAVNQNMSTVDSVTPPVPVLSQTLSSASVDESETSRINHKGEDVDDSNTKKDISPNVTRPTGENGDSKLSPKKRESSTSTDSESDSSSSVSSSSQTSRSDKKRKSTPTDRKSSRYLDTKSRKRSRSNSPKYKHEKRKSDRRDSNDSSRKHSKAVVHDKLKKHQSRSKKHSKEKSRRRSESSKSSHSSSYSQHDYSGHSERSRRRSRSHHRHHRKSRSHSHRRSRSTSRYREDSQSRSYSRRESYGDKHKSDSNKYKEEYRKSRKESRYSRSRSPSVMSKRYRRKSRSLSTERRSHYKKSKIRTHDR